MKQKTSERFTDVMIELAKINAKLDAVLELTTRIKVLEAYVDAHLKEKYYPPNKPADLSKAVRPIGAIGSSDSIPCFFETIPKEDWNKPMGISCPCRKCSPYALSSGSLGDSGLVQEWRQTLTNQDKLVDCISTISIPPATEYVGGKKDV